MGNKSNLDQWATMERLRFIERSAYWRGVINRQDLSRVFGLSMAQASADLQAYQRINAGALVYNLNRKRYEGAEGMRLRVRYFSVSSGRDDWRWLRPRCFAHNGDRWHVRAWCEQREHWADFTLSRMVDADWPEEAGGDVLPDDEGGALTTICVRPH